MENISYKNNPNELNQVAQGERLLTLTNSK